MSGGLAERATVTLDRGQSAQFAGYTLTFETVEEHPPPDRLVTDAHIVLRFWRPRGPHDDPGPERVPGRPGPLQR